MNPRRHNLVVRPPFYHRHVPPGRMRADGLILAQDTVVLLNLLAGFVQLPAANPLAPCRVGTR